ncbi:MAG: glucosamine-6-phosphate deaminase [Clostridia bacterium]|nr:glucosamine-6-phosphate deaminase [Clostridia bacterium]
MKIIRCKDYDEMSVAAARLIEEQIAAKPDCVLGLATGSTPEGMYAALCRDYKEGKVDFSKVTTVNLDEYCGLPAEHDQSYRYFMNYNLFDHVNVDPARTFLPNGNTPDPDAECVRYEKMVAELGYADLQILGVGRNGHIGFNEPATALVADTHVTDLTADTINANSRFFASENEVPKRALTMGVGTIMASRKIVIMASGEGKRAALAALLGDVIDTNRPVTLLKLHRDVTLVCDEAAWPGDKV